VALARATKEGRSVAPARKTAKLTSRRVLQQFSRLELARVVDVNDQAVMVEAPSSGKTPERARTVVANTDLEREDQVVVARLAGAEPELVILGRLFNPLAPVRDVRVNGRKVSIEANTELVLKCASATIRIAKDGLVAIRGDRVVNQARGTNRIRGGSVEIN
jgi:hypothetical protein